MTQSIIIKGGEWGHGVPHVLSDEELGALEAYLEKYRRGGKNDGKIIGQGMVSIVVEWEHGAVIKPLPLFPSKRAFDDYASILERQFRILAAGSVGVLSTTLQGRITESGAWAGYLVQPRVATEQLLPQYLRSLGHVEAVDLLVHLASQLKAVVSPGFGLDGDITNWCVDTNGRLLLLDCSTPLLRDEAGHGLLDFDVFLASIPRYLRAPIGRFVVPRLVSRFFETRRLFVDILSGFYSEELSHLLPQVISRWNPMLDKEICETDVLRYKKRNERMWRALDALGTN